ncbi:MAG: hypothetical protein A2096_11395 [Spirochaetes bacterium GWF1_41_5]|nr:MAG: hypothetical protein A2096_11395 [Spirochaetes bacterium GWF1_41_5]
MAFAEIYRRYYRLVPFIFLQNYSKNYFMGFEDLIQIVFMRLADNLHYFNPQKGKFSSWFSVLCRNCIINFRKSESRHSYADYEKTSTGTNENFSAASVESNWPHPEDELFLESMREKAFFIIRSEQNELWQKILLLRLVFNLKFKDISQILCTPEGTLKPYYEKAAAAFSAKLLLLLNLTADPNAQKAVLQYFETGGFKMDTRQLFENLNPDDLTKKIIIAKYIEGQSITKIAENTGLPEDEIKNRLIAFSEEKIFKTGLVSRFRSGSEHLYDFFSSLFSSDAPAQEYLLYLLALKNADCDQIFHACGISRADFENIIAHPRSHYPLLERIIKKLESMPDALKAAEETQSYEGEPVFRSAADTIEKKVLEYFRQKSA